MDSFIPVTPFCSRPLLLLAGWLLAIIACFASTQPPGERVPLTAKELAQGYRDGAVLAQPRQTLSSTEAEADEQREGFTVRQHFARFRNLRVLEFTSGEATEQIIRRLRATGRYEFVEPDRIIYARTTPNDPSFAQQWSLSNTGQSGGTAGADIGALAAWDVQSGAPNVIVAVIDSGILLTHTDLVANLWTNPNPGASGISNDLHGMRSINGAISGTPSDDDSSSHGTHVSGIIGAVGNNGTGISGVAWKTQLMALKFLAADGTGITSDAINCIDYAIAHGAAVINASYGTTSYSQAEYNAIQQARAAGIVFVAAAGNDSMNTDTGFDYPAGYTLDNIVTVAATTRTDALASYSNFGSGSVDLAAPGDQIYSTIRSSSASNTTGTYGTLSGTSMAAPHVTGALALMKARFPTDSYRQLINRLLRSVTKLPALSGNVQSGGRLNLAQALTSTDNRPFNDDFASRAQLKGANVTVRSSNVGATAEAGEPQHAGVAGGASLWWSWTAPVSSAVAFDTKGSAYDTTLAIYTGSSLGSLQAVAANDDTSSSVTTSRVLLNVTAGTTYQIAVDGKNGVTGLTVLSIGTVPANDNFANAQLVTGTSVVVSGSTANASAESGEPTHAGAGTGHSVWYKWIAPSTGHFELAVTAPVINPVAAVYTGTAVAGLTQVAANNNSASYNTDALVPFNAIAGQTYFLAVDNTDATGGSFTLTLTDSLWQAAAGDTITSSPAVGTDGTVYFGSGFYDAYVYAINSDGTTKWSRAPSTSSSASFDMDSPALGADGTVYIGSGDSYLYALNGSTGSRKWRFLATTPLQSAPAIASDGTIYFRDDTNLYALTDRTTTYTKKWSYALSGGTYCSPVIASDGTVYVGATGGSFYAVNPDGTQKWTFTADGDIYTSPAIAGDGTIYFATLSGSVYALNPTGTQKWVWKTSDGSSVTSSPALGIDGSIYFAGYDHKLHALRSDGTEKWSYLAADEIRASSPAIGADGTIYFGDYDGLLYAINPDGTLLRTYATAAHIRSSPVIANNRLYFGSNDFKLYAFPLTQNAAASFWPMFQQNAARTGQASAGPATIVTQPQSQTIGAGSAITFSVAATGASLGYQWQKNGTALAGATAASYTIASVAATDAGTYTVVVTGLNSSVTSTPATLTVQPAQIGRLVSLSVRAPAGTGAQTLIVGFAVNGTGANKPVLVRGIGPGLAAYGVAGTLPDPQLTLLDATPKSIASNNDWGNTASLNTAFSQLFAFALDPASKDAALLASLAPGLYTAQITDVSGSSGVALAEVYDYDLTPSGATLPPMRLTSISARAPVGLGGQIIIAGFSINGNVTKKLLIRGIGPALASYGVTGYLANPRLDLYNSSGTLLQSNDDWGGTAALNSAFTATGAFVLSNAASLDAAMIVTLAPGTYTAQVSGVNSATGVALVEVYELP